MRDGKLVGIVSRSNPIQAFAWPDVLSGTTRRTAKFGSTCYRGCKTVVDRFRQPQCHVTNGVWGLVGTEAERKALLSLAESVPGVSRVADEMIRPTVDAASEATGTPLRTLDASAENL